MGYLLDTNIALSAVADPEHLSSAARAAIEEGPVLLSVIVYWEVAIKSMKGTLEVGDPRQWWAEMLDSLSCQALPFRPEHVAAILELPPLHQDPFDRALIAQAMVENLTLLTTDAVIPLYAGERLRVIR